jgi:hypothetical protein
MPAKFNRQGISFSYPENWTEEFEESESGWTVVIQSPATAFLSLTLDESMPGTGAISDAALDVMREEYPKLESEPATSSLADRPAVGHDINFFSFDLTNTCKIRAIGTGEGTIVVMTQATDSETTNLKVLEAICKSLEIEDE